MGISISTRFSPDTVYYPEEVTPIKEVLDRLGVKPPNFEYCNSVRITHGPTPSRCYFLLRRSEYAEIAEEITVKNPEITGDFCIIINIIDDSQPIKINNVVNSNAIRYKNWTVTDARVILGHANNPDSIVLLTIEDIRYQLGIYSCWQEFEDSPTNEFIDSYNVLRHTPKIYNGYAEDLVENNADYNGYYFYKHTLKPVSLNNSQNTNKYELWNAKEIAEKVFNEWTNDILGITKGIKADELENLHPMNLCVSQLSYLDFLTKLAQISKTYYYVNEDGMIVFDSDPFFDPRPSIESEGDYAIENVLGNDLTHTFVPKPIFVVQEHCFYYSNNESDAIDRRFHIIGLAQNASIDLNPVNSYSYTSASFFRVGGPTRLVNIPHLFRVRDIYWNNTEYINNYVSILEYRLLYMENKERTLFYHSIPDFILSPGWTGDIIVYGNFGYGTHMTVIGVKEYEIDYYTAKFEDYYSQPVVEYWRYVQTGGYKKPEDWNLEEPDPEAPVQPDDYKPPSLRVYNPAAPCRLYYPANNKKVKYRISPQEPEGVEVVVEDPLGTHINDPEGTKGVCIQVGQRFFVVESIAKKYYTWTLLSTWTLEPNLGVWYALATLHDLANDKIVQENAIIYDRLKMFTDQQVGDRGYCYYQPEMPDDPNISSVRPGQPLEYWAVNAPCEHWTGYD